MLYKCGTPQSHAELMVGVGYRKEFPLLKAAGEKKKGTRYVNYALPDCAVPSSSLYSRLTAFNNGNLRWRVQ
jgi:hypothetical protein